MFEDIRIKGDFTLNSGKKSEYYYATERIRPWVLRELATYLLDDFHLWTKEYEFVAVPALGGVPFATIVAQHLNVPLIIVEKDNSIRGDPLIAIQGNYLIVDDVISTYGEVDRVQKVLGQRAAASAALIFRGEELREDLPTYVLAHKEVER